MKQPIKETVIIKHTYFNHEPLIIDFILDDKETYQIRLRDLDPTVTRGAYAAFDVVWLENMAEHVGSIRVSLTSGINSFCFVDNKRLKDFHGESIQEVIETWYKHITGRLS